MVKFKFLVCLIFFFTVLLETKAQDRRPNIIVFMVDDMGWMDTSLPFANTVMPLNRVYHTPNMEQLAKEGMKFTSAYATSVCTPSRVSMLTGLNAAHHQVTNWTSVKKDTPSDRDDEVFNRMNWNFNGYSPVPNVPNTIYATAMPQVLKQSGYFTVHVGKAHWGAQGTPGANPLNLGFLVNVAGNAIGHPQSYYGKENYGNMPGQFTFNAVQGLAEYYGTNTFLTEALTLEALKSIDQATKLKQPFYLHLSHYALHDPIQGDPRFVQKYVDKGMDPREANYASLIEGVDKSLGDVMEYLTMNNLEDNTIIIFMSDNGGLSLEPVRGGGSHTQNLPLKAGKGSLYEGGIREPMIVKWPSLVQANSTSDQPVIIEDFFPSILEMAGIERSVLSQKVDGKSFVPLLQRQSDSDKSRPLIWYYPHKWTEVDGPGINYFSAIRQGRWKLIYDFKKENLELYDLSKDIGEHKDLVRDHKAVAKELARVLTMRLKAWNVVLPTYKSTGKSLPWPEDLAKSL